MVNIEKRRNIKTKDKITDAYNHGTGFLMIISIFYLIMINILNRGGILSAVSTGSTRYAVTWLLNSWCIGAADIFMILTGFIGFSEEEKKTNWARILTLWLEVVFYAVLVAIIYKMIYPDSIKFKMIGDMFLPLLNNNYQLFSAFIGIMIFKPFLDSGLRHIQNDELKHLMLLIVLVFSCLPIISDTLQFSEPYSLFWFVILYLLGASLKKTTIIKKITPWKAAAGIFILSIGSWLWKLFGIDFKFLNHEIARDSLISIYSPLILLSSVFYVILFTQIDFSKKAKNIIAFFTPGAWAVYLIGCHPVLWQALLDNRFREWAVLRNFEILYKTIGFALIVTFSALVIDKFRQKIFSRLKIQQYFKTLLDGSEKINILEKPVTPVFIIFFTGIWIFLFLKCPYGYGYMDEALYLTVPYRILKYGDGLLIHEWHEFQMSTFPTLPLHMLYYLFFSNTEQILLNFRYIFTFLWGCSAIFFYIRMKRISKTGAAAASLVYLIHAPYSIMAFSYNSMGVLFLLNAFIIALTAQKHKKLQFFISGLFLAGAILCCPYLLVLYLLLTMAAAAAMISKKNKSIITFWLFCTLGAICLLVIFCAFLLSKGSLQEILQAIPIVLDDVEHPDRNLIHKTIEYIDLTIHCAPMMPHVLILFTLMCIVSRLWKKTADLCLSIVLLLVVIPLTYFTDEHLYIHYLMLPVCLIGFFCRINSNDEKLSLLFRNIWIPGMIYTFCLNYSSNQQLHALTNAAVVPAFASIVILILYLQHKRAANNIFRNAAMVCSALLLFVLIKDELILRWEIIFFEDDISEQVILAKSGPEKGIRMTESKYETYESTMNDIIKPLQEENSIQQILFFTNDPVLYLCTEKGIGSFSAWLPGINDHTVKRLDRYYELNPQKIPDAIYIPQGYSSYLEHFQMKGYEPSLTEQGDYLLLRNTQ